MEEFLGVIEQTPAIGRRPNNEQRHCIESDPARPTMIVAGPGSGKTTVLVLRALRHIAVDRIPPEGIVITTFTNKAAREIRSRLIEWGEGFLAQALVRAGIEEEERQFLSRLDINRVVTGTLDSICQEALGSDRRAEEPPLVTLEAFAASVLLQRRGRLGAIFQANRQVLAQFLSPFTMDQNPPGSVGEVATVMVPIIERFIQDRVDVDGFGAPTQPHAHRLIAEVAHNYRSYLAENNLLDFVGLEQALFNRLRQRRVPTLLADAAAVLVDEYQDTNALQEAIYLELVQATGAAFTVVGDDDQSLYRFRGATIELFRAFIERCARHLRVAPHDPLYLVENYRSTEEIVEFFNHFIRTDPHFGPARIQPPKPVIHSNRGRAGMPVLAMFRSDCDTLAAHLAGFLHNVFRSGGYHDPDGRLSDAIRCATDGGDLGDAVFLGFSVQEMQQPYFHNAPKPRFTHYFRQALAARNMLVFNPRGRSLRDIDEVQRLMGLVILCIDPPRQDSHHLFERMFITDVAKYFIRRWVGVARDFLDSTPPEVYGRRLAQEMDEWTRFVLNGNGPKRTSRDWPFLDVIYGLVPWISHFEDDPEGQVYLEAISRAAGQASGFSAYNGRLVRPASAADDDPGKRSIEAIIRDVVAPIAENVIDVDEEIMPSVPRDRLNVMTIHQAKGLEYPLVIVDVGADFSRDHPKNRFRRFPESPTSTAITEDMLANFTPELGPLRLQRTGLERSFEDLVRLYYVAYSRPQSVLMLVGCNKMLRWRSNIKHVALGWRQDETWDWRDRSPQGSGRRAPAVVSPPNIQFI